MYRISMTSDSRLPPLQAALGAIALAGVGKIFSDGSRCNQRTASAIGYPFSALRWLSCCRCAQTRLGTIRS
jgi:hypothetical protein